MDYRVRTYMRGNVFPKDWEVVEKLQLHEALSIGEFDPGCDPKTAVLSTNSKEYWERVEELLREHFSGEDYREIPDEIIEEFIQSVLVYPERYVCIERK